ncbi:YhdP family protein, partial [Klebsiella quasipneumoniae]|uniref:YhdP family protein n=1 Tax=Klebsiella quasipneumoniae TaxID=1463165 RepID=UPI001112AE3C
ITGTPLDASQIDASWQTFGETVDVRDIHVVLKDGGKMAVKRGTLAVDVGQSLLHMRWQFRDLTLWQLQVH